MLLIKAFQFFLYIERVFRENKTLKEHLMQAEDGCSFSLHRFNNLIPFFTANIPQCDQSIFL